MHRRTPQPRTTNLAPSSTSVLTVGRILLNVRRARGVKREEESETEGRILKGREV